MSPPIVIAPPDHVELAPAPIPVCRQAMPLPFGFALRAWNKLSRTLLAIFWPPEEGAVDPLAPLAALRPARFEPMLLQDLGDAVARAEVERAREPTTCS
jgi:hypothetical protein